MFWDIRTAKGHHSDSKKSWRIKIYDDFYHIFIEKDEKDQKSLQMVHYVVFKTNCASSWTTIFEWFWIKRFLTLVALESLAIQVSCTCIDGTVPIEEGVL